MPTASDEQRAAWGVGNERAEKFLENRGFVLGEDWCWRHPAKAEPDELEWGAIEFLMDEWDYGGFNPVPPVKDHVQDRGRADPTLLTPGG